MAALCRGFFVSVRQIRKGGIPTEVRTLGEKLRALRREQHLTQEQAAGDYITRNMLSRIENDSATPSMRTLEYLASRLGLPASRFMEDGRWSELSIPDGLDEMRRAYREQRWQDCLELLESSPAGTSDEGYLLRSLAALSAARAALGKRDFEGARQYADSADYYNRQGLYYSAETDAEMSLILAECALELDEEEFEGNASEFERAVASIRFDGRYALAKAEHLIHIGEPELCMGVLKGIRVIPSGQEDRFRKLKNKAEEMIRAWALREDGE